MSIRTVACTLALCLNAKIILASDCPQIASLEAYAANTASPDGGDCSLYLTDDGATGTSCHWTFPFRDQDALDFANTIYDTLKACRPGHSNAEDQPVNHPDSYELREWITREATYAVSVKDKGGLHRTLVFLRLEPSVE